MPQNLLTTVGEGQRIAEEASSPFRRISYCLQELDRLLMVEGSYYQEGLDSIEGLLDRLSKSVSEAEAIHHTALHHAETLSVAQADALVHSAEVIEELERTRGELMEARLLAERHQRERVNLLSRVFENAREGVVILDAQGLIREVNPVFQEIAQKAESQLAGKRLETILPWTFEEFEDAFRMAMSGMSWTGRASLSRGEQGESSFLLSFSPVQNDFEDTNYIVHFSDVTDIEQTQLCLKEQALHDQLTKLPNRRFFREKIQALIHKCQETQETFAVCFIDLDDFKHVNDSLGHLMGDELLMQVSERIRQNSDEESFVARFGGDEFAILIANTRPNRSRIAHVTNAILTSLREPFIISGTDIRIGASIGVTEYPNQAHDLDELLQFADVAMYAAKNAGRNQIRVFSPEMQTAAENRNRILRELHRALAGNEISVFYQPLIDLKTGRCTGCEALARWRTPDGRQISPAEFVPIAEQTGLIVPFSEAILNQVCRQLVEWESQGCRPTRVAVNLSPRQLHGCRFIDRLKDILGHWGVNPHWITLEITENAVMEDVEHVMKIMDELTAMGIQIALDDFGTGYSSLNYLRQFNVYALKIDRSFIKDLPEDGHALSIVQSVIHMAQGRKLSVVAEGIETRDQLQLLREINCDLGQGFYISHPLPAAEFANYYRKLRVSPFASDGN